MSKITNSFFLYPLWVKTIGFILIIASAFVFVYRILLFEIVDLSGASSSVAMGLIMIFFSKEKIVDERIVQLKFKSLAVAVPTAALITMLINYSKNFSQYSIETDSWYSISAFEYLTITLCIAIGIFSILKVRE
jgi:hypothetical protein